MTKSDFEEGRRIHLVPPSTEWDGTFPFHIKTRADLHRYYSKFNLRKLEENTTGHHRRKTDIHVMRKLDGISKPKQPFFPSSNVTE